MTPAAPVDMDAMRCQTCGGALQAIRQDSERPYYRMHGPAECRDVALAEVRALRLGAELMGQHHDDHHEAETVLRSDRARLSAALATLKAENERMRGVVEELKSAPVRWECMTCKHEPDAIGPGCDCSHAPCLHDRNGTIATLTATLSTVLAAAEKRLKGGHDDSCAANDEGLTFMPRPCSCGHDELAKACEGARA